MEDKVYKVIDVSSFLAGKVTDDFDERYKQAIYNISKSGVDVAAVVLGQSLLDLAEILSDMPNQWKDFKSAKRLVSILLPYGYGFDRKKLEEAEFDYLVREYFEVIVFGKVVAYSFRGNPIVINDEIKSSEVESFFKMCLFFAQDKRRNRKVTYGEFIVNEKEFIDSYISGENALPIYSIKVQVLAYLRNSEEIKNFTASEFSKLVNKYSHFMYSDYFVESYLRWFKNCYLKYKKTYAEASEAYFDLVRKKVGCCDFDSLEGFDIAVELSKNYNLMPKGTVSISKLLQQIVDSDANLSISDLIDFLYIFRNDNHGWRLNDPDFYAYLMYTYGTEKVMKFFLEFEKIEETIRIRYEDFLKLVSNGLFDTPELGVINSMRLTGAEF